MEVLYISQLDLETFVQSKRGERWIGCLAFGVPSRLVPAIGPSPRRGGRPPRAEQGSALDLEKKNDERHV